MTTEEIQHILDILRNSEDHKLACEIIQRQKVL